MKVTVRSITGFEEAFDAMYMSKRTWTPRLGEEIRSLCANVLDRYGNIKKDCNVENLEKFDSWMCMLLKMGRKHITVIKYIDIAIMTEGIHRAGQDDIDAHAERFDNRNIRNSTRLSTFSDGEMSDYYKDKILTTDQMLSIAGINVADKFDYNGSTYIKTTNGYVKEEYKNNKDVKRGLYMLSIPSNFVAKINLAQWGHVFQERNKDGGANPEVKQWAEMVTKQITDKQDRITRDYILSIKN